MVTTIHVSYRLCESTAAGIEYEKGGFAPRSLIARCFISLSPINESECVYLTAVISPVSLSVHSPVLELHPALDTGGRFFSWCEVSLAMLPHLPLQIIVRNLQTGELGPQVILEFADGQVLVREKTGVLIVTNAIGKVGEILDHEVFWFDDLGYAYEQAAWLLQLGACLVHSHELAAMYQLVCFLPDQQIYEYRLCIFSERENSWETRYTCFHNDLRAIEWEHAINLKRFSLGINPSWQTQKQLARPKI